MKRYGGTAGERALAGAAGPGARGETRALVVRARERDVHAGSAAGTSLSSTSTSSSASVFVNNDALLLAYVGRAGEITPGRTEEGAAGSAAAPENEGGGKAANIIGAFPLGTLTHHMTVGTLRDHATSVDNNGNEEKERAAEIERRAATSGEPSSALGSEAAGAEAGQGADRFVYPSGGRLRHAASGGNRGGSARPVLLESDRAARRGGKRACDGGDVATGGGSTVTSCCDDHHSGVESELAWQRAANWGSERTEDAQLRLKATDAAAPSRGIVCR